MLNKRTFTLLISTLALYFISLAPSHYAQAQPAGAVANTIGESTELLPVGDENVPSMFFGSLTPEEALSYSQKLQQQRLTNPDAELEIPSVPTPTPVPIQPVFETVDGVTRGYFVGDNGAKHYIAPTSAILRELIGKKGIDAELTTFASNSTNALALAMLFSPRAASVLLEVTSLLSQTVIYADTLTPSQCATQTCIAPTYGNGSSSDKGDLSVLSNPGYDYAPSVMWDGGKYKMWWCGNAGLFGDNILYAESSANPLTGWSVLANGNYGIVFSPTNSSTFDGSLTCDPSVVKVGAMYYMYYSAFPLSGYSWSLTTRIGAAYSNDGISWTRWNGGTAPIVNTHVANATTYGVSHPSVVYVDGYFYMTFDDDSGVSYGQYALRSSDPFFQTDTEEWQGGVWTPLHGAAPTTQYPYLANTTGVDWAYSPATKEFVVGIDAVGVQYSSAGSGDQHNEILPRGSHMSVAFFDKTLSTQTRPITNIQGQWFDSPAVVKYSSGSILENGSCSTLWIRMLRAGRDWPSANASTCETDLHNYLVSGIPTSGFYYAVGCTELSYLGYDVSTGVGSCRPWATGVRVEDDYDGDGLSDPVIWRPSTGVWWTARSQSGSQHGEQWGLSGDQPIFGADYDADRTADPAVKRGGDFYVLPSTGNCPSPFVPYATTKGCVFSTGWSSTDVPVPGDYDGDGMTDIAARSTSGTLKIIPSSGSCPAIFTSTTYAGVTGCYATAGGSGDKPLVGDYDGDGKTDISWHSPTYTQLWTYPSAGGSCPNHFAAFGGACYNGGFASGDIPVTGDFDGDGKTDAMWRTPSNNTFNSWGMSSSSSLVCPPAFTSGSGYCLLSYAGSGGSSDIPLAKDFNANGKVEPTLVIPSFYWFVNNTSGAVPPTTVWTLDSFPGSTIYYIQWGLSGDRVEGLR